MRDRLIEAITIVYDMRVKKITKDFVMCPQVAQQIQEITDEYLSDLKHLEEGVICE